MSLRETLFGRPLRSEEQERERIGAVHGVPVLGLDALASASYGPEAALTVLIGLGVASTRYITAISAFIVTLLLILSLSYRQTIGAYPNGGGSYAVARTNLGERAGVVTAAALFIDYILNVAVAVSAGVGAIVSAVPALHGHTLSLCLVILTLITVVNLRGVREAGLVFMLPTYVFVACLGGAILWGLARTILAGGAPAPVAPPHSRPDGADVASSWLFVRAFASGCTAMTGIEAVSNGVPLFRKPEVLRARRALAAIVTILGSFVLGVALLSRSYGITATHPGAPGYESVLSQLVAAVGGRGVFYYVTMASIVVVLCLSANTSFASFPRLCRVLARDEFLPAEFAHLGRRLVYSHGVVTLALISGALLVGFGGITDRLIPLFAVGAFLAFTMSQIGMVRHWLRNRGPGSSTRMTINVVGACATGVTLIVISVSKFAEGAWVTLLLIPLFVSLFLFIQRNHDRIGDEMEVPGPVRVGSPPEPIVVIPLKRLDRVARKSLRFGLSISSDVRVVQVRAEDPRMTDLRLEWGEKVERPARAAGFRPPQLVTLTSSFREVFGPLIAFVNRLTHEHPRRLVAVVIPEVIHRRWYHFLLHSQRPALLKAMLFLRGGPQVVVINTPWYLDDGDEEDD